MTNDRTVTPSSSGKSIMSFEGDIQQKNVTLTILNSLSAVNTTYLFKFISLMQKKQYDNLNVSKLKAPIYIVIYISNEKQSFI